MKKLSRKTSETIKTFLVEIVYNGKGNEVTQKQIK